jgi:hypothetical protein
MKLVALAGAAFAALMAIADFLEVMAQEFNVPELRAQVAANLRERKSADSAQTVLFDLHLRVSEERYELIRTQLGAIQATQRTQTLFACDLSRRSARLAGMECPQ